jgi:hypothetical protein
MNTKRLQSKLFLLTFILLSIATASTFAQSKKISLQGFLKDANGKAVADGSQSITFKLYTVATGGTAAWTDDQNINVYGGVYSTYLGSVANPVDALNWGAATYYVGVTVQGTELTPRTELTFAPYSLGSPKATNADLAQRALLADTAKVVKCSGAVGDVKYSILNPTQFAAQNGDCWVPMDGRALTVNDKLRQITGINTLPNAGGLFIRSQEMNGSNNDSDRTESSSIAALQSDNFGSHNHVLGGSVSMTDTYLSGSSYTSSAGSGNISVPSSGTSNYVLIGHDGDAGLNFTNSQTSRSAPLPSNTANSGQTETRPKNLNLWTYIRIN